jgi:hypothetical protein
MDDSTESHTNRWLVLTHQLPSEPAYLRVKVRRRLDRIGAIPVKSSVYALPATDEALEDLRWLLQEIALVDGEASLAKSTFLDGATHERLVARCRDARDGDYHEVTRAAGDLLASRETDDPPDPGLRTKVEKLVQRLEEIREIDFFGADGRVAAERAVGEALSVGSGREPAAPSRGPGNVGIGRTWVTRRGVKVDRIASAWLIRRFIDPEARFAFVDAEAYVHAAEALRFDMFEGEYGHVGNACTFETLLAAFRLDEPALKPLAEIVHDLDFKDGKFARSEGPGVAALVDGIVRGEADDQARLERGAALLDALLEHFRTRPA